MRWCFFLGRIKTDREINSFKTLFDTKLIYIFIYILSIIDSNTNEISHRQNLKKLKCLYKKYGWVINTELVSFHQIKRMWFIKIQMMIGDILS